MMTQSDLVACVIIGGIMLLCIAISVVLLKGKGAWLIAGYNTLSQKEKAQYDSVALCKLIGKYLLSVSMLMPALPIGWIFEISWPIVAYVLYLLIFYRDPEFPGGIQAAQ